MLWLQIIDRSMVLRALGCLCGPAARHQDSTPGATRKARREDCAHSSHATCHLPAADLPGSPPSHPGGFASQSPFSGGPAHSPRHVLGHHPICSLPHTPCLVCQQPLPIPTPVSSGPAPEAGPDSQSGLVRGLAPPPALVLHHLSCQKDPLGKQT